MDQISAIRKVFSQGHLKVASRACLFEKASSWNARINFPQRSVFAENATFIGSGPLRTF